MAGNNMIETFNMTLPPEGPGVIPITLNFSVGGDETKEIDLTQIVNDGAVSYISGVTIDTLDMVSGVFELEILTIGQRVRVNDLSLSTWPLYVPNPPKFIARSFGVPVDAIVRLQFVNFPVFPFKTNY